MSKISTMIGAVALPRPKKCPGFYCVELLEDERYPCDGSHYVTATKSVPTFVCLHFPGQCKPDAEIHYFLLKCLAMGLLDVNDWNIFFPVKGDLNRFAPNFSEDEKASCVGYEIVSGRSRVAEIKNPGLLQAPFDFNQVSGKVHTTPCMHIGACDQTTRYKYALMTACVRNPLLLVKDGLGE